MHQVRPNNRMVNAQQYRHELAKAKIGDNVANHMAFIFTIILHDKFDFKLKRLENFHGSIVALRKKWQDDDDPEVTNESLMNYAIKKKVGIPGFVKSIPFTQKLFLGDGKGRIEPGAQQNIDWALCVTLYLTLPVLKEKYKFSNAKIEEFMKWVKYYIDSYYRKQPGINKRYCDDEYIRKAIIEDTGWDLKIGKKVV